MSMLDGQFAFNKDKKTHAFCNKPFLIVIFLKQPKLLMLSNFHADNCSMRFL